MGYGGKPLSKQKVVSKVNLYNLFSKYDLIAMASKDLLKPVTVELNHLKRR